MSCYGAYLIVPDGQCIHLSIREAVVGGHYGIYIQTCMTGVAEHGTCINGITSRDRG